MNTIRILYSHYNLPHFKSLTTIAMENILSVLRKRAKVQIIWLIYKPEKLDLTKQNSEEKILDIHDFKNAVEVVQKVKPDIIFSIPTQSLISLSLSAAGKFLDVPVVSILQILPPWQHSQKSKLVKSYLRSFFQSSVPTDSNESQKKFMKRGRFFLYRYLFLLRTQKAVKMNIKKRLEFLIFLLKIFLTPTKHPAIPRFAVDRHWLEGQIYLKQLANLGFDRSTLAVTGAPAYDHIFQKLHSLKIYQKNGKNKKHILFAPDAFYEHGIWSKKQRDTIIQQITAKICEHKSKFSLTVKIHPSVANLSEYQSIINSIDSSIPIFKEGDILDYLVETDVVIAFSSISSAMTYALIAEKPIVICNYAPIEDDLFLKEGLAVECRNPSFIFKAIQQALVSNPVTKKKREEFIQKFLYKGDGLSSERICDDIFNLLKNKN